MPHHAFFFPSGISSGLALLGVPKDIAILPEMCYLYIIEGQGYKSQSDRFFTSYLQILGRRQTAPHE